MLIAYTLATQLLPYGLLAMDIDALPSSQWYPWNFSPLMTLALFAGACPLDRRWSFAVPLIVMVLRDFGILALTGKWDWAFSPSTPILYGCFLAAVAAGFLLRSRPQVQTALPLAILAEGVFFLVTNFAVWVANEGYNYPATWQGLGLCYAAALPFFGRSLLSTGLFTTLFFSPLGLRMADVTVDETGKVQPVKLRGDERP
jgi:hypothetical protein